MHVKDLHQRIEKGSRVVFNSRNRILNADLI